MNSTMKLRTSDPSYLQYVERWYRKVLPMLKDLTYANGGPIITAQVHKLGDALQWVSRRKPKKHFCIS